MARVLIAGCGYVGSELAARLADVGHRVHGLRRRPHGLPAGVVPVAADLTRPETLVGLPEADVVFYTAAADGPGESAYRAAYADGLANLIAALAGGARAPARLFFTSSTAVYAQDDGGAVDETSPAEATSYRGRILREAEVALASAPFPGTTVRLGGIYGPGRTSLIDSVREGRAAIPVGPPHYTNRIHRDDCAGLLHHLMDLPEPADLYLGVDCESADRAEVLRWLAARLGVVLAEAPPGEPASSRRTGSKRCSNRRLLATGYRFAYPTFREGYAALLADS